MDTFCLQRRKSVAYLKLKVHDAFAGLDVSAHIASARTVFQHVPLEVDGPSWVRHFLSTTRSPWPMSFWCRNRPSFGAFVPVPISLVLWVPEACPPVELAPAPKDLTNNAAAARILTTHRADHLANDSAAFVVLGVKYCLYHRSYEWGRSGRP